MNTRSALAFASGTLESEPAARAKGADVFSLFSQVYARERKEATSLTDYLEACRDNPSMYATAAERMIAAIGEPTVVDTSKDQRLGRLFHNRTIKLYPSMAGFFGMEDTIQRVVSFFQHAAQGLEERKQILYLLGPVGGGKSSLAERLKHLIESQPIYVLAAGDEVSPIYESPLGMFRPDAMGAFLEKTYGIPQRRLTGICSPWATKRLDQFDGDLSRFSVVKMYPSKLRQVCVAKTEPGDDNNQDISALVGKVDIRQLEHYSQHDPDAYSYSGGLNRTTQGLLEFVEMFKAPIKVLHPLLTATQEGNYVGTESIGAMPYQGVVLAHSNESEWEAFKHNKNNEAFLDRICVVKVPYCLRVTEEAMIYGKLLETSDLGSAPCAPEVLEMLAGFSILSRLKEHQNSPLYSKLRVYNGESLKDTDPKAKSIQEYRESAGGSEGMSGISTRFAFKVLSETFNYDSEEIAADPVHLMYVLEQAVKREQYPKETEEKYLDFIKSTLAPRYADFIGREIQKAYIEVLQRIRPEPVRPLHRLCRRLDRGAGLQGSRHRSGLRPAGARRRTLQDGEAGGHREPKGFPKRNRQVRAALARGQPGQESVLDRLREDPRSDREAHVQPGRGSAADHQFRSQAGFQDREEPCRFPRADDVARLHRAASPTPRRMVYAGQQSRVSESSRQHASAHRSSFKSP